MNSIIKIISFFAISMILLSSCSDNDTVSTYDDILKKVPFAEITDSIKKQPENSELYFRRAVLLNSNNYPEPSLLDFKSAWNIKKEEKYALGISTLLLETKPDSALLFLKDALLKVPGSFLLQLSLARAYAAQNKIEEALKICNDILQTNPQQVDILKMKADLLDKKGNKTEATITLEKAYQLAPFDVELNYILALNYAEAKNVKVLALTDSLIKADSIEVHAEPYYYKGIYYSNIGDRAKALLMFDEAVKHDYTFIDSYIEKGSLLYEMKKYPEALKVFNLALTISPDYPDNFYWIGKSQEAMGQREEALLNYQRALGLNPNFKEAKEAMDKLK